MPQDNLLYDDDNQLSSWNSQAVGFDDDGNMTTGPLPNGTLGTYVYDSRNRLTNAGSLLYAYGPDGLRVSVTAGDITSYAVDPNAALSRTLVRTKSGVTTFYVYGLGLLYEETGGAMKAYHFDHLGSTVLITDGAGQITDRVGYGVFGGQSSRTGSTDTPFLFHGEHGVMTDANGLCYMRARFYNPRLMRFCNADPIGFEGGFNWYVAFDNNPVLETDPTGLFGDGRQTALDKGLSPEMVAKIPLGHSDMGYRDPNFKFDYIRADHEFRTSPFNPFGGISVHFQTREKAYSAAIAAANAQNKKAFEVAVHAVADVPSHHGAGFRTFGGKGIIGHLLHSILTLFGIGKDPDDNPAAWEKANRDVKALEDYYKAKARENAKKSRT